VVINQKEIDVGVIVEIRYVEPVYSPFTGQRADGEETDGPNVADPSLCFVYYGNAHLFGYVAERVLAAAKAAGIEDVEDLNPEDLLESIKIPNSVTLKVDTGFNGTNYYCFAAPEKKA
jgi:hypothetical protein